jgi:hypothetical protein
MTSSKKVTMVCVDCGATYPREEIANWGRYAAHAGLGSEAHCYALVPNGHVAPVPDDKDPADFPIERRRANEICAGVLIPEA